MISVLLVILLAILTVWIPIVILKPFSKSQKIIVFIVIALNLLVIFVWHYFVVRTTGGPIIRDINVDAWRYYNNTRVFQGYSLFAIRTDAVAKAAGGRQHLGYWYLNAILHNITSYPVLTIRLLKSLVYFAGLASVMRVWRRNYGNSLPMYGFVFLTVVFWLPAYYNFRNLKDGLLSGLFLLCMALLDTLIRPRWQILTPRTKGKTVMGWCLLLGLLWIISTIRLYYAAAIALGFSMHLIGSVQMDAKLRVAVITTAALLAVFVIGGRIGATALKQFEAHKGGGYGIFGIFRGLVTPIPWQYFIKVLIPSHCFYLLMLPFAFFAFFAHFRVNLTWHAYTAAILIIAVGIAMEGSQTRKRMIVVPIFVMWILVRMALKRGIHIMQRREQLLAEQAMFEEFPEQMLDEYDYEEQFLYDHV